MIKSHDDLVSILSEHPDVEVVFEKEIIDESDSSPDQVAAETGRKHRNVVECTVNKSTGIVFYTDKILFEIGSAA